jgi:hypothetical protein
MYRIPTRTSTALATATWTAIERHGAPHAGVVPLLRVQRLGIGPNMSMHAIICGLLPAASHLAERTGSSARSTSDMYPRHPAIYHAGIEYRGYYRGGLRRPEQHRAPARGRATARGEGGIRVQARCPP